MSVKESFEDRMAKDLQDLLSKWSSASIVAKIPLVDYKRMLKDRADELLDEVQNL